MSVRMYITLLVILCSGCATSRRGKMIERIAYSSLACGAFAAEQRKYDSNRVSYGAMYGGLCGTAAGLVSAIIDDDSDEMADLREKNLKLHQMVTDQHGVGFTPKNKGEKWGRNYFMSAEDPLPDEYKEMVEPGTWKLVPKVIVRNGPGNISSAQYEELVIEPPKIKIDQNQWEIKK